MLLFRVGTDRALVENGVTAQLSLYRPVQGEKDIRGYETCFRQRAKSQTSVTWCKVVYFSAMKNVEKPTRQSISLPPRIARRIKSLAKTSRTSANKIIVDLIESGLEAKEQERKRFFELADRLVRSRDLDEQNRIKEELARLTFGE